MQQQVRRPKHKEPGHYLCWSPRHGWYPQWAECGPDQLISVLALKILCAWNLLGPYKLRQLVTLKVLSAPKTKKASECHTLFGSALSCSVCGPLLGYQYFWRKAMQLATHFWYKLAYLKSKFFIRYSLSSEVTVRPGREWKPGRRCFLTSGGKNKGMMKTCLAYVIILLLTRLPQAYIHCLDFYL